MSPVENHCVKGKKPDSKGYILYGPFTCHSGKGKTGGTENSPLGYGVRDKKLITKGQYGNFLRWWKYFMS